MLQADKDSTTATVLTRSVRLFVETAQRKHQHQRELPSTSAKYTEPVAYTG